MGCKDIDDVPPFVFNGNTDSSTDEESDIENNTLQDENEEDIEEIEETVLMVVGWIDSVSITV